MGRKGIFIVLMLLMAFPSGLAAREKDKTPLKMGALIEPADSAKAYGRRLEQRLFITKGEFGVGAQFSYLDLASSDSQVLMLLQNFNAYANTFSVSPLVSYAFADNRSVGIQMKYSTSDVAVSQADLSLMSEDLKLDIKDVEAHDNSIQTSVFYRSCIGLDSHGRFGLFNDILLLVDRQQHEQKKATGNVQEQIERAAAYFNENYNTKISIDDYAESLHISTNWFIHNFKQYAGMSPAQYILSLRMVNAQSLLERTTYNIKEISEIVGYENPLYFSRVFKKEIGKSPAQYRKEMIPTEAV